MPNKRTIRLDKYGISQHRFLELKNFCLQYNEWKDILKYQSDAMKGQQLTGMPFVGGTSNSTLCLATKKVELQKNCDLIENTMIQAIKTLKKGNTSKNIYDGNYKDLYDHMIKSVTNDDINYTYLDEIMNIPIGRDSFNNLRRYFFYLLDKNKN
jgi:hypothetical protein